MCADNSSRTKNEWRLFRLTALGWLVTLFVGSAALAGNVAPSELSRESALLAAAGEGNLARVKKLLEQGADVKAAGEGGQTPILAALDFRPAPEAPDPTSDIVKLLLAHGAAVNAADAHGDIALIIASQRNDLPVVQLLLDNGARTAATNHVGATPLMLAVLGVSESNSARAESVVKVLLKHHAGINARDARGQTALFYAAREQFSEAGGFLGNPRVIQMLLENGADPNVRDFDGQTALLYDARQRPIVSDAPLEIMRRLLAGKADINAADKQGDTALMVAAARGRRDFAELLIGKGAALDATNLNGDCALRLAIEADEPEITELLLSKGAAMKVTPYPDRPAVTEALLSFGLMRAARGSDTPVARALLDGGARVNFHDRHARSVLMEAAESPSRADELTTLLLARGADIGARDDAGNTALMLATLHYNREMVRQLLAKGAEVNVRNKSGRTALLNAAEAGDGQAGVLLVQGGADVKVTDATGKTALILAAASGMTGELVRLLLTSGAEANAADNEGRTPLMAAAEAAQDDNVRLLLEHGANVNARAKNGSTVVKLVQAAKTQPDIPGPFVEHLDEIIALLRKAGAVD